MATIHRLIGYASADWHVPERRGGGQWSSLPEVSGDSFNALRQIADLCRNDNVPLFAAGDLIDGPDPDPEVIAELYGILRGVSKIYYVLGNHERGRDWLAPLGSSAVCLDDHVNRELAYDNSLTVSGFSCMPTEKKFLDAVREFGLPTTIGLYHQQWYEFIRHGKYRVSDLPQHELAICGDVHVRQVITPASGPKLVLSPGPLAPQSAAEIQPHATYAIHRHADLSLSVESVPLSGRPYLTAVVDSEQSAHEALQAITALGDKRTSPLRPEHLRPLVNIRLTYDASGFTETVLKLAEEYRIHVRFYGRSGSVSQKIITILSISSGTLAAAITASESPDDVKQLALKLTEPGANPREVLVRARADHEVRGK